MPEITLQYPIEDDSYYQYEPDTPAPQPEPDAVLRQIPKQIEEKPCYLQWQHCPEIGISINIMGGGDVVTINLCD